MALVVGGEAGARQECLDAARLAAITTRAGQFVGVSVEIDGVRETRPYSPASSQHAQGGALELTISTHPEGKVSRYLRDHARPGMIVGLTQAQGAVHPSADVLFEAAAMAARHPVAVILTGMGNDGTRGAGRFAHRGLPVLVQRPDTCIVGGMPGAAIEAGVASESLSLENIAARLRQWASPTRNPTKPEMANPS